MLKDFEDQLKGLKKGEFKKIEFDYPKDYFNKELAGKHAMFDVTIKEIKNKAVPELNEDFAKDMGFKTIEEVRTDLKKRMESAAEYEAKNEMIEQAMEHLISKNDIEAPESIIMSELKGMFENFVRDLTRQGRKFEYTGMTAEQFIEKYKPVAKRRVKGLYILDSIAKTEKIEVTDEEIEAKMNSIATQINQPIDKVKEHYKTKEAHDELKYQLFNQKVLDFVISKAKIKSVKPKKAKK